MFQLFTLHYSSNKCCVIKGNEGCDCTSPFSALVVMEGLLKRSFAELEINNQKIGNLPNGIARDC